MKDCLALAVYLASQGFKAMQFSVIQTFGVQV